MSLRPYYEHAGITIYHGDCREILPELFMQADCIVTDPPYGIGYKPQRVRSIASTVGLHSPYASSQSFSAVAGDTTPFDPRPLLGFEKVAMWGANHYSSSLPDSGGWLVWDKKRGGTVARGFIASDVELAWSNFSNCARIFSYLWSGLCRDGEQNEHFHPTQKPVALMKWVIELAEPARAVIDPYMGSGTTLIAAKKMNQTAIGIDIEEKYCEIAAKRLSQEVFNFAARGAEEGDR